MLALLALSTLLSGPTVEARKPGLLDLLRVAHTHCRLRARQAAVTLPQSAILATDVSRNKRYGDSWTCRESTRLLLSTLAESKRQAARKPQLQLHSAGKNAFKWGKEGWVSYHYFAVDRPDGPSVLVDPTACSNFSRDVQPGGLLRGLLQQAGTRLGHARAARRVAQRIERGGIQGLLILRRAEEIAVYTDALEQAAKMQARVARQAERAGTPAP